MSFSRYKILGFVSVALAAGTFYSFSGELLATVPSEGEISQARIWAAARFDGKISTPTYTGELTVLANNDPVQKRLRNGKPMNINGKIFKRGLYCHAVSDVVVKLPGAAKTLLAEIGVDSNDNTSGGRGSIEFIVATGDKELFHSDLIREGTAPANIEVDLRNAKTFSLRLTNGGDDISCDQGDWANARVEMTDGSILWLDELPFTGEKTAQYSTDPFFSFVYDGTPSTEFLQSWERTHSSETLDENRIQHQIIWTDPKTQLQIRCEAIEYCDFPTVEWTLYFKNLGSKDTPILSDIQALDTTFQAGTGAAQPILHRQIGAPSRQDDYRPILTPLENDKKFSLAAVGGKGTDENYPYFNIEYPGFGGLIVVVGWPAQWAADFTALSTPNSGKSVRIRAGQELTHLILNPGEEIRTPLMAIQFWNGEYIDSQNIWRSWMLAYNVPHPNGKVAPLHWAACSSHQYHEMIQANSESQINCINRYLEEGIKLDYWWMDAGWYINNGDWPNTGTWEIDQKRFPGGFRPISDHANAKGVKTLVWFEPERVTPQTWLYDNHPEWLLRETDQTGDQRLLNLGNKEAWTWLVNHIDNILTKEHIGLYRQDYNIAPLNYWRKNDAPNRQGITENHYTTGYLAYWDALLERHPGMLIDSCASGGRRNDLETMRRAVPLLRSDYIFEPTGQQGHSYGMALWIPLFGTGMMGDDNYNFRSCMAPFVNSCWDIRPKNANYDAKRKCFATWNKIKEFYYGEYYPLTPYTLDETQWVAWQYNRPDLDSGMIQAFCRPSSPYESIRIRLQGLNPGTLYTVEDIDGDFTLAVTGKVLMDQGLLIQADKAPQAPLLTYKRAK